MIKKNILQLKNITFQWKKNNRKSYVCIFSFRKNFRKNPKKQFGALKTLDPSNKKNELKQTEGIFTQNLKNDLIRVKLTEIVNLQDFIITDDLYYKSKHRKNYNFGEYS